MATCPDNLRMHYNFYPERNPFKCYMVIKYLISLFAVGDYIG